MHAHLYEYTSQSLPNLLRVREARAACAAAAQAGKAYSAEAEQWAPRPLVRLAVAKMAARIARRNQPAVAERGANWFAAEAARRRISRITSAAFSNADGLYRDCNSSWAGGNNSLAIEVGEPACNGESYREWSRNGKWSGHSSRKTITVPADWLQTVHARDLAVVDGLFTLAAEPVQGHGPELFAAAWVEQGRGVMLKFVRGYIARQETPNGESYTYHACSARAALDGVQRKAKLKPARRKGTLDLDRLVRRHGDLPVYWQDARDCGLCVPGIRNWCTAVGISASRATVAEVVAGYKLRPLPEVIRVLRRVVRDARNRQPVDVTAPESALESETGRVEFDAEGGFRIVPSDN